MKNIGKDVIMLYTNINLNYQKPYNSKDYFTLNSANRFQGNDISQKYSFEMRESEDYMLVFSNGSTSVYHNFEKYNLSMYDTVIFNTRGYTEISVSEENSCIICVFSGHGALELLERLIPELLDEIIKLPDVTRQRKGLYFAKQLEYIMQELHSQQVNKEIIASAMFVEFLGLFSRTLYTDNKKYNKIEHLNDIYKSIEYIDNNNFENIDINKLIKSTYMSQSYFYSMFKKVTGKSPVKYINERRLSIAADYLTIFDMSVSEVSTKFCYCNVIYFSKQFKKLFGMSPAEYKRSFKEHNFLNNSDK